MLHCKCKCKCSWSHCTSIGHSVDLAQSRVPTRLSRHNHSRRCICHLATKDTILECGQAPSCPAAMNAVCRLFAAPPPPRGHTEPLGLGQPSASHLVVHEVGARKVCCRPPAPCCPCSCPCVEGSNHCQVVTALSQGLQSVCVGGDSSGGVGTQGGEEDNGGTALRKVRRGGCLAS